MMSVSQREISSSLTSSLKKDEKKNHQQRMVVPSLPSAGGNTNVVVKLPMRKCSQLRMMKETSWLINRGCNLDLGGLTSANVQTYQLCNDKLHLCLQNYV